MASPIAICFDGKRVNGAMLTVSDQLLIVVLLAEI